MNYRKSIKVLKDQTSRDESSVNVGELCLVSLLHWSSPASAHPSWHTASHLVRTLAGPGIYHFSVCLFRLKLLIDQQTWDSWPSRPHWAKDTLPPRQQWWRWLSRLLVPCCRKHEPWLGLSRWSKNLVCKILPDAGCIVVSNVLVHNVHSVPFQISV